MVILISPVSVLISHFPPEVVFGTLTRPVSVSVINNLSERRLPQTLPVSVITEISPASQWLNVISPVVRRIVKFSDAITLVKAISPVSPVVVSFLH